MKNILKVISSFRINSFSELNYKNRKMFKILVTVLAIIFITEAFLLDKKGLLLSAFAVFGCLKVAHDYKDWVVFKYAHYISAAIIFIAPVVYGGLWTLIVPILVTGYLYLKERDRDIHLLVFELLLFLTTQISILL